LSSTSAAKLESIYPSLVRHHRQQYFGGGQVFTSPGRIRLLLGATIVRRGHKCLSSGRGQFPTGEVFAVPTL
jgi:hypothetical protein